MPRFTKEDVQYHSDGFGRWRVPAVNVKVHDSLAQGFAKWRADNPDADARYTVEWIEEHIGDNATGDWFNIACESGYETAENDAQEIWGSHTRVYSQGRQGGWAVVDGFTEEHVEQWDAIELAKWARFAKWARGTADYTMALMVDFIYINVFDSWTDEQSEIIGSEAFAPESMLF